MAPRRLTSARQRGPTACAAEVGAAWAAAAEGQGGACSAPACLGGRHPSPSPRARPGTVYGSYLRALHSTIDVSVGRE